MPEFGFEKGFLKKEVEKRGGTSDSGASQKGSGKLSVKGQQLAFSGVDPKTWDKSTSPPDSSTSKATLEPSSLEQSEQTVSSSQSRKNRLRGFFNQEGASLIPQSVERQAIKPTPQPESSRASSSTETRQPEQLSKGQLQELDRHCDKIHDTKLIVEHISKLPKHIQQQYYSYRIDKQIEYDRERGSISKEDATGNKRRLEATLDKMIKGEAGTDTDHQTISSLRPRVSARISHEAAAALTDEMEDMELSTSEDLRRRVKDIQVHAQKKIDEVHRPQ
jgi:hypothetical protein